MEAEFKESRISRFLARRWAVPLVIAGAVTIVSLACITPDLVARWQLSRERDAIRARGEPATLAELAPEMPPDDENAAVLLVEAFKLMDAASASEPADWTEFLDKGGLAHRAEAEAALKLHAKAMALAREALARPRCVFDLDYTKGAELELPHLASLRHFARLFGAEAILHALDGERAEAADSIRRILLLARATDEETILISKLVTLAVAGIGMNVIKEVEAMGVLGDEERRLLAEWISLLDFEKAATEALIGERIFVVDGCDGLAAVLSRTGAARGWISRWLAASRMRLSRGDKVQVMRLSTAMVGASRLPPWEARPIVEERNREVWTLLPWAEQVGAIDDEQWKRFYTVYMRAMASRDAAVIGFSCELFRSARGQYPGALDELAPEFLKTVPPDPFTGKPFKYQLRDDGATFIVYSVGDNLKDDGGVQKRPEKDDISWEGRAAKE